MNGVADGGAGYYSKAISSILQYDFLISGLTPENDYILYGLLVDQNDN